MDPPVIGNERQARAEVARRTAMGLSYIKIYNGLSREAYFAIADECRKRGLQMVGRIPDRISAEEVALVGQASVEQLDGILLACSRKEIEARWLVQPDRYPWETLLDTFDAVKADALIESFREGAVWQTPTLIIYRIGSLARDHRLPGGRPVQYARRDYLNAWPVNPSRSCEFSLARTRRLPIACRVSRCMKSRRHWWENGLSPAAALRTATWHPAEFLHVSRDYGSVEPGKVADLVVLDAKPLITISNTTRIHAVMRRGRLIESAALRSMLEGVQGEVGKNAGGPR